VENAASWQDTADYDMGDAVPFRVTSALPGNMGSYKQFHFTFADAMEPGFTRIGDFQVTLDGEPMTDYTVNETDDGFELTLSWDGGEEYLPKDLGGKEVEILFAATLNEKAALGEKGNVNAMRLRYSNNPLADTEQETKEKRVLVFTYGLTVNKTDENGNALPGAAFILEKKLADGTRKQIALNEKQSGASSFVFTGLDDGSYILTESKAPVGYVPAAPTEFILSTNHASAWDGKEETRAQALTGIQTTYSAGYVSFDADKAAGMLSGSAVNSPEPTLEHKADDKNDSNTLEDQGKHKLFTVNTYL
jgi:fimbrial isopeptide formation D2 family protein